MRILCRVLEVSVSGFYAWRKRPQSAREREDGELTEKMVEIFQMHRGVYGSPRLHAAEKPNQKWAVDVTSIPTACGWLSLAVVLDLFSRRIVGWAMSAPFDETLVEQALEMALTQRKPEAGVVHHSDRGCQSTSHAYQTFLKDHGIQVSMSRKGNCWDNAVVERFFGTLKREGTSREHFKTREEARTVIFESIEAFYNRVRKHSTLGYLSPVPFEIVHS